MAGIRKREGGERGEGGRGSKGSEARLEEGKSWRLLLRLDFPVPSPSPGGAQPPALPSRRAPRGRAGLGGRESGGRSPGSLSLSLSPCGCPLPTAPCAPSGSRRHPRARLRGSGGPSCCGAVPACPLRVPSLPRAAGAPCAGTQTRGSAGRHGQPALYTQSSHVSCQEQTFVQELKKKKKRQSSSSVWKNLGFLQLTARG